MTDTGEWTTRRYLSLLGNILIWVIVAIDAFYLWPTSLHGSTSMVIVAGHSMEPTYFTGDLVIARKTEPSIGDVIVYAPVSLGGSQIVHRIIGGNATDGWKMQGDNNNFVDPFTPKGSEVKGVVLVHYANFGRVTVLLLNPLVWAFVLLAAIILLVWWSGDTCDDDPGDKDKDKHEDGGDPEPDAEEEPDLIDRVVEGTEAAVARMVTSGADAGAAVLAALTRPSPTPRHATAAPSHRAPALLRGSAIIAVLGLLAIYGPSTASASQLTVNAAGQASVMTVTKCDTQNLAVTPTGTHTGTTYTQVTVSGIAATCLKMPINVYLHDSAGAVYRTFSSTTPTSGTTMILTLSGSATYDATLVSKVIAKVNGWLFVPTWAYTAGPPPFPSAGNCDGILLTTGQLPVGVTCTLSVDSTRYNVTQGGRWIGYALVVVATTSFSPGSGSSGDYQALTKWRFTLDLSSLAGVDTIGGGTSYYVYKYGNENIALAPGATCSNPASVTFQEALAGNVSGSTLVVTKFALYGWDSKLLCQTP